MSIIYSNGSVTHTFGNVACVAMNYVKKFFPDDYFQVQHISTKLAYKQLDIFKSKKEFWKLHKPMLILRPRIEMDDSSKYFYGAAFMNRMHNVTSPAEYANRITLFKNEADGVMMQFLWNRYKIYYDIVIIVDSYNEQLNLANHIINSIVPNTPFMIHNPLEAYVPKCIIEKIAEYRSIPLDKSGEIVGYLNSISATPFTYKYKDGSGNNEYFTLYDTNIEAIPSDLSIDDGSERGMITDSYTLSFTLSCEFNTMSAFYLYLRDNTDKFIPYMPSQDDNRVVPLFSIPLLFELDVDPGWKLATAPSYFVSSNKNYDTTCIKDIFTDELKSVLAYQKAMKLPLNLFVKFRVFKGNKELPNSKAGFEIDLTDYNNPILTTYDVNIEDTYRIFVLINNEYIHSIVAELTEFNKET